MAGRKPGRIFSIHVNVNDDRVRAINQVPASRMFRAPAAYMMREDHALVTKSPRIPAQQEPVNRTGGGRCTSKHRL